MFDDLSGCSSEEDGIDLQATPMSFDKLRAEKKYQKRFKQVFDTLVDRVDGQSSSGNNSSDDTKNNGARHIKKRKFNEFNDSQIKTTNYVQASIKRRHPNEYEAAIKTIL